MKAIVRLSTFGAMLALLGMSGTASGQVAVAPNGQVVGARGFGGFAGGPGAGAGVGVGVGGVAPVNPYALSTVPAAPLV